jgi:hypothetical protein
VRVSPRGVRFGFIEEDAGGTLDRSVDESQKTRDLEDDKVEGKKALKEAGKQALVARASAAGPGGGALIASLIERENRVEDAAASVEYKALRKADHTYTSAVDDARKRHGDEVEKLGAAAAPPVVDVSEKEIVLRVGKSSIRLTDNGIEIVSAGGQGIRVCSTGTVTMNDAGHQGVGNVAVARLPEPAPPRPPSAAQSSLLLADGGDE